MDMVHEITPPAGWLLINLKTILGLHCFLYSTNSPGETVRSLHKHLYLHRERFRDGYPHL